MTDEQTHDQTAAPAPTRRPAGGAPLVWRWIGTGALLGFVLLGGLSLFTDNESPTTGVTYSGSTAVGLMGVFGAALGALAAAVVLALVVGRRR